MFMFLNARRKRGVTAMLVILAFAASTHMARADSLIGAIAPMKPKPAGRHRHRRVIPASPPVVRRGPQGLSKPQQDGTAPPDPELDSAKLAQELQALLICAIPPPMDTIIQTTTPPPNQQQPGAPAPPQFILPSGPDTPPPDSGQIHTADAPEPASLVTALVGTSLTGLMLWHRKKRRRRMRAA